MKKLSFIRILLVFFLVQVQFLTFAQKNTTAETALVNYVSKDDTAFQWIVKDSYSYSNLAVYNILFTSQVWRGITWTHQLTIIVPEGMDKEEVLLFITGGGNKEGLPKWNSKKDDRVLMDLAVIANSSKAVVALLRQAPNQPLFGSMTEDELISYTLHNFKKDRDYEWPLLFPMVKSATKAMDVIEEFSKDYLQKNVDKFVVSGASKRGWTAWLTAAADARVKAIAPMVIDILNMPKSLDYQIETWGDYSIQIQDYVTLGIPQSANTSDGQEITTMIDPYSYRHDLTMPKLMIMGTNDEYWVLDNVKNYIHDLPGTNILHYVPNVGHDLGGGRQAMIALGAFFMNSIHNETYPNSEWEISEKDKIVSVKMQASKDILEDVIVWFAQSDDKDFRNDEWTSTALGIRDVSSVYVNEPLPKKGYKAFYVDLKYKRQDGESYTQSSRIVMMDSMKML